MGKNPGVLGSHDLLAGATGDAEAVGDVREELWNRGGSPGEPTHVEGGSTSRNCLDSRISVSPGRRSRTDSQDHV